jgi:hypothetical protein
METINDLASAGTTGHTTELTADLQVDLGAQPPAALRLGSLRFHITAAIARWRARRPRTLRRFTMMELDALDERARGPGWFDSSWDLDRGLDVDVAAPGDPMFAAWIDALARASAAVPPAPTVRAEASDSLAFEAIDWAPPAACSDAPIDAAGLPLLDIVDLQFVIEPMPPARDRELELELVPM